MFGIWVSSRRIFSNDIRLIKVKEGCLGGNTMGKKYSKITWLIVIVNSLSISQFSIFPQGAKDTATPYTIFLG